MSRTAGSMSTPGSGRITLALLAVVPAALAYPWQSTRAYLLIGIAVVALILLFGRWRGLYFTTVLRRRLAIAGRGGRAVPDPDADTSTTALLRVGPAPSESAALPLPLIAGYLDCYGIKADSIRITNRDTASGRRETWIGLTVSAVDNLPALQARSSRIPLHETAEVAARRLADHLREIGWEAATVVPEDVPELLVTPAQKGTRESWRAVQQGATDYVAAYRVKVDEGLADTLEAVRSQRARETWTALEIAPTGHGADAYTMSAACALRTDEAPGRTAPTAGLTLERGNQRPALAALDPLSTRRLDGHTEEPAELLARLAWPVHVAGAHRAPSSEAPTAVIAVSRT